MVGISAVTQDHALDVSVVATVFRVENHYFVLFDNGWQMRLQQQKDPAAKIQTVAFFWFLPLSTSCLNRRLLTDEGMQMAY